MLYDLSEKEQYIQLKCFEKGHKSCTSVSLDGMKYDMDMIDSGFVLTGTAAPERLSAANMHRPEDQQKRKK